MRTESAREMTLSKPPLVSARAGLALAAAAALLGCADADAGAAGAIVVDLDPCGFAAPPAALVEVSIARDLFHPSAAYARIEGLVQDGPDPQLYAVSTEAGGCRYLKGGIGSCDPACAAGELCTIDGVCAPYPLGVSGGALTVRGLGDPIEIAPEDWNQGVYVGPANLPADLFDSTDVIGAELAGGDFPAVALGAKGVDPLDAALVDTGFEMLDGQDAEISWTPGADPEACVRVVINGPNAIHGAPLADVIECEGPDTGSLTIPQALVEEFPHGTTPLVTEGYDWPHSELTRYTRSSADAAQGPARLVVRSTEYFLTSHPE
jgi:hypothetical protein